MSKAAIAAAGALACAALVWPALAEMYKWTDENGKVHYTDSVSKIPRKFRKKGEGGVQTLQSAPSNSGASSGASGGPAPQIPQRGLEVPAIPAGGGHQLVEAVINGRARVKLMVDTGASMVILHPSMALDLGIQKPEELPMIQVSTAGGREMNPIVVLDTVRLGRAVVRDVQAAFNTHMPPDGGLLGMTVLGEFRVEQDHNNHVLILRPLNPGNDTIYGDRPLYWWKNRFKEYWTGLNQSDYAKKRAGRLEKLNFQKLVLYYKDLVDRLTRRADAAGLPEEPRHPFEEP